MSRLPQSSQRLENRLECPANRQAHEIQRGIFERSDWRCRYDLQTGKFDVPPLFSDDNAKALTPARPGGD
jgi:hypothetical protein